MELDAQDAIAQIDQRCSCIREDYTVSSFAVAQRRNAGSRFYRLIVVRAKVKIFGGGAAKRLGRPIERDDASRECVLNIGGKRSSLHLQARYHFEKTDCIPKFERTQFVPISPAHGPVDFDDAIRNL